MNSKHDKLIWNAVPTLFDVPNKPSPVTQKRQHVLPKSAKSTKSPVKNIPTEHENSSEILMEESLSAAVTVDDLLPSSSATLERVNDQSAGSSSRLLFISEDRKKLNTEIARLRKRLRRQTEKDRSQSKCNKGLTQKQEPASCDHLIAELSNHLPPSTVSFLKTQINMGLVSKQGRRWTDNEKMFAMSIFYQSRKVYKLLQNIFCLPSKRTLQRTLQKCSLYPGFSKKFFDTLRIKLQHASDKAKDCVLIFDEMALKRKLVYNRERDCIEGFEDFGVFGTTQCIADFLYLCCVEFQ